MMAFCRCGTLLNAPRRMLLLVISAKNRSTRLSQDAEVGVKWMRNRRCSVEPTLYRRRLVGGIVVDNEIEIEMLRVSRSMV